MALKREEFKPNKKKKSDESEFWKFLHVPVLYFHSKYIIAETPI